MDILWKEYADILLAEKIRTSYADQYSTYV
jgi:hypothetical protein